MPVYAVHACFRLDASHTGLSHVSRRCAVSHVDELTLRYGSASNIVRWHAVTTRDNTDSTRVVLYLLYHYYRAGGSS